MSAPVDLTRRVRARAVEGVPAAPGEVLLRRDEAGRVVAYTMACPGCGDVARMEVGPGPSRPRWLATAGDLARPEAVTLTPSIHCTECCGWHGWLRNGELAPY